MELRINPYQLPDKVTFNFEELKNGIAETLKTYEVTIYSDDQIKQAKADRAKLNGLKNALNDERIRREREYLKPFNEFKTQVNEIIAMIDKPVQAIDKQVRGYEDQKKKEKQQKIRELFENAVFPDWVEFERIFNQKWLNASVSLTAVNKELIELLERIEEDLTTLADLPEFAFEATEIYKSSLNINTALNEAHRLSQMAQRKAEAEARKKAEEETAKIKPAPEGFTNPPEPEEKKPEMEWLAFRALMTTDDALALRDFFQMRDIRFEPIRG